MDTRDQLISLLCKHIADNELDEVLSERDETEEYLRLAEDKIQRLEQELEYRRDVEKRLVNNLDSLRAQVNNFEYIKIHFHREKVRNLFPGDILQKVVITLLENGEKIRAIKVWRDVHNTGLKEAKEAIEDLIINEDINVPSRFQDTKP